MARCVLVCCLLAGLVLGCDPEAEIEGIPGTRIHLIPFRCTYFGIEVPELSDCSIACPASVIVDHDLRAFTQHLECTHPAYSLLRCGIAQ